MANKNKLREETRQEYFGLIFNFLKDNGLEGDGEEVLLIGSNQLCFPIVDKAGNELFIKVVVSIPNGSKDPETGAIIPFDGYEEALGYEVELKNKKQKQEEQKKKKQQKIERDEKIREANEKREGNKEEYRKKKGI